MASMRPLRLLGVPVARRASAAWAAALARHPDVDITMKIYAHTNLDAMRQAGCYIWPASSIF
jgi:hypothetical protein